MCIMNLIVNDCLSIKTFKNIMIILNLFNNYIKLKLIRSDYKYKSN